MRTAFAVAAFGGGLAVFASIVIVGGVLGGLIGLQSPDFSGPLMPDLNGGLRGAYAGLIASAVPASLLAVLTGLLVRRWGRRAEPQPRR